MIHSNFTDILEGFSRVKCNKMTFKFFKSSVISLDGQFSLKEEKSLEAGTCLNLEEGVGMLQEPAHHCVARLMVGHRGLLGGLKHLGLLLQP